MSVLNISQIMEILPHRQPMLLIDSVEEIEYGVRATFFCRTFSGRTGDAGGADRGGTGADRCGCNSWKR